MNSPKTIEEAIDNIDLIELEHFIEVHRDNIFPYDIGELLAIGVNHDHLELVKLLHKYMLERWTLDIINLWTERGFLRAIEINCLEIAELLLIHGANVNTRDGYSIQIAAKNGHIDMIRLLIKHGAVMDTYNLAFIKAAENGHLEIVKLLDNTFEIDIYTIKCTIVHCSKKYYQPEVVEYLITKYDDAIRVIKGGPKNGFVNILMFLMDNGEEIELNNDPIWHLKSDKLDVTTYFESSYLDIIKSPLKNGIDSDELNRAFLVNAKCGCVKTAETLARLQTMQTRDH
jgi:hypothetical protein